MRTAHGHTPDAQSSSDHRHPEHGPDKQQRVDRRSLALSMIDALADIQRFERARRGTEPH